MTITTKENASGKTSAYFVDGVKTCKCEIDYIISDAAAKGEIIYIDYYVGTNFRAITRSPYKNLKVVFTGYSENIMTQAAADELGYSVIRKWAGRYFNAFLVEKKTTPTEAPADVESTAAAEADANVTIELLEGNSDLTLIDDESPFEIDDESPFDLLPSIDELNDTLSDFEIEDEQFAGEDTDRNARFNRGERLAEAATSRIRNFDKTADITFDVNEDDEDTFLLDSSTIYRTPFGTAADAEQAFFDIIGIEETAEISEDDDYFTPPVLETIETADEILEMCNGICSFLFSDKYNASLVEKWDGTLTYRVDHKIVDADEFFRLMSERGACIIDDEPKPADDDNTFIATDGTRYIVKSDHVDITSDGCLLKINGVTVAQYKTAHAAQVAANDLINFRENYGGMTCLPHKDFDPSDFDTMFSDTDIDFSGEGNVVIIGDGANDLHNQFVDAEAAYTAAKQAVIDAENALRRAKELERQTFYKFNDLRLKVNGATDAEHEAAVQCRLINAAAPEGWSVIPDAAGKNNYTIKFGSQPVATIDSLALAKVLPLEKFFEQFKPLADKSFDAKKQFIADRQREIEQLKEMREELAGDPERLKIIDKLITQNELAG